MNVKNLIVENTFNVSASKVWNAITSNDEMKNWYFKLEDFKPKVGFKFNFIGGPEEGPQYLHLCEVKEVVDLKKIAYSWRYDNYPGNSLVTWEIFDKGAQTLLRLTHTRLETFAELGSNFAVESFKGGWTYFLHTALKNYLKPDEK